MIQRVNSPLTKSIHTKAMEVIKNPSKCEAGTKVLRTWGIKGQTPNSGQVLYTKKLENGFKKVTLVTAHADNRVPTISIDSRVIDSNGDILSYFYGIRGNADLYLNSKEQVEKHVNSVLRCNKDISFLPIY